jgi:hypothetical protein
MKIVMMHCENSLMSLKLQLSKHGKAFVMFNLLSFLVARELFSDILIRQVSHWKAFVKNYNHRQVST